jgi:hypothetical protein
MLVVMDAKSDIAEFLTTRRARVTPAGALQIDDPERAHLFDLARAAGPIAPKRRRPAQQRVRPAVLRILESISAPAIVRSSRVDYVAANPLGRALYAHPTTAER